ncbi:hypothetical protein SAMN05661091_5414 [Paenibacillus uliginis N3/975]|uniref:Amidase n=1 Tax=Paenibacillus uliginis N3/975 TaxID=1313296 RepID=A0A1X7HRR0_9BACL|nr:hypothetical protein [Paenibacillus uliginis]SMF91307.1 hypothetical protein SAMN05661091_5414 [Paenibacillus uliginis N3/975]
MRNQSNHRFYLLLACCLLFLGSLALPSNRAQAQPKQKATWFWDTAMIKESSEDILSFASANGVNTFYLQMNRDVRPEYYKNFIRQATARGIEVHVLGGSPSWSLESERYRLEIFLDWTAAYQASAAPEERFTGVHIDIEPHVLGEWSTNRSSLIKQWQSNVRFLADGVRSLNLPITADIPFWLYTYNLPDDSMSMSRWIISKVDAVVVMAYRDQATNIYNLAIPEMDEATELGKKAIIAVETKSGGEGNFITFYEEGSSIMNEQLQQVDAMAAQHASYDGLAIHEYRAWKDLVDRGN